VAATTPIGLKERDCNHVDAGGRIRSRVYKSIHPGMSMQTKSCDASLTVKELVGTCKARGIRGYSRLSKEGLVDLCCKNLPRQKTSPAPSKPSPVPPVLALTRAELDNINAPVLQALRGIGSSCHVENNRGRRIDYGCNHDKDDGRIFEARRKYEDDIDDYDDDEDLDDFVEDDDFPNFIGQDIVEKTVEKAASGAGFPGKASARDHEKGFYEVLLDID
jgi:hypothetical protein